MYVLTFKIAARPVISICLTLLRINDKVAGIQNSCQASKSFECIFTPYFGKFIALEITNAVAEN
jgi:hypothetical protein